MARDMPKLVDKNKITDKNVVWYYLTKHRFLS